MSHAVCYLERADRGCRIVSARLVAGEVDEVWVASRLNDTTAQAGLLDATDAAAWVRDRMAALPGRRLDAVCVDADGSACTWLTAPSNEHSVVVAALAQGRDALLTGGGSGEEATADAFALEACAVQAVDQTPSPNAWTSRKASAASAGATGRRLAVLVVPDSVIRVFLDELDGHRIAPRTVESLWHGLSRAWDPSADAVPASGPRADRVVAESQHPTAVVLVDPRGRLSWSWSRGGDLLTGGGMRLAHAESVLEDEPTALVHHADVARLTTDWLSWAAQLGTAPTRIVCIAPRLTHDADDALDAAGLGRSLATAWPSAGLDMVVHEDPIGATLRRLAGASVAEHTAIAPSMLPLTRRPARVHRAMHIWLAVAIVAVSAVFAAMGIRLDRSASRVSSAAESIRQQTRSEVEVIDPQIAASPLMMRELQIAVDAARARVVQTASPVASKPVMQELLTVAMILSGFADAGVEVEKIDINHIAGRMDVLVPQTSEGTFAAEQLDQSLRAVRAAMAWQGRFATGSVGGVGGARNRYQLVGTWRDVAPTVEPAR